MVWGWGVGGFRDWARGGPLGHTYLKQGVGKRSIRYELEYDGCLIKLYFMVSVLYCIEPYVLGPEIKLKVCSLTRCFEFSVFCLCSVG
jgi:hypothetical protein